MCIVREIPNLWRRILNTSTAFILPINNLVPDNLLDLHLNVNHHPTPPQPILHFPPASPSEESSYPADAVPAYLLDQDDKITDDAIYKKMPLTHRAMCQGLRL